MQTRSVMTVAGGMPVFLDMALNLAHSFEHWHRTDEMNLYILTDLDCTLPRSLRRTHLIRVSKQELPQGFSSKLSLDKFIQSESSIFLDADCLVLRRLDPIFDIFRGSPVGVFGHMVSTGEWFGDVEKIRSKLGVTYLPRFNGGLYYLTDTEEARRIYGFARQLEPFYDSIGFIRLRGQANEEMLMAASLAHHGILPVCNPGSFYGDFQWWPQLDKLNVLQAECRLKNPDPPDPRHQNTYPAHVAEPIVLHFLGEHVESAEYKQASTSFRLASCGVPAAAQLAKLCAAPRYAGRLFKRTFRPAYRRLFGVRAIQKSKSRLILRHRL